MTMNIRTIPKQSYKHLLEKALSLAPHKEDAPHLAVALLQKIPIWSNDSGMKDQDEVKVYTAPEILRSLGKL